MPVRKGVIPAAGLGTRFLPASKAVPKVLLPVVDRPVIQYAVEEMARAGISQICIVMSHGQGAIADHFSPAPELEAGVSHAIHRVEGRGGGGQESCQRADQGFFRVTRRWKFRFESK